MADRHLTPEQLSVLTDQMNEAEAAKQALAAVSPAMPSPSPSAWQGQPSPGMAAPPQAYDARGHADVNHIAPPPGTMGAQSSWQNPTPTSMPMYPPGKAPLPNDQDALDAVSKSFKSIR